MPLVSITLHGILHLQEDGGQLYQALEKFKFSLKPGGGGLNQMGDLKFFTLFWENSRVFSNEGIGEVPPPLDKNYLIPPLPGKVPPSRLSPTKVHSPH